jgi:hypothetical protein
VGLSGNDVENKIKCSTHRITPKPKSLRRYFIRNVSLVFVIRNKSFQRHKQFNEIPFPQLSLCKKRVGGEKLKRFD